MAKIPQGIWKKLNYRKGLEDVEYFGIGNDRVTYHIERVTGNPLYKWVAKNPNDASKFFFGKTLDAIKRSLDSIPKQSETV